MSQLENLEKGSCPRCKKEGGVSTLQKKKKKKNMGGIMSTYLKMGTGFLSGRDFVRLPIRI